MTVSELRAALVEAMGEREDLPIQVGFSGSRGRVMDALAFDLADIMAVEVVEPEAEDEYPFLLMTLRG